MDAYDSAVLSYALATAACKIKPSLLGLGPAIPGNYLNSSREDVSLTPPTRDGGLSNEETDRRNFLGLLSEIEQMLLSNYPVQISQLLDLCSHRQVHIKLHLYIVYLKYIYRYNHMQILFNLCYF